MERTLQPVELLRFRCPDRVRATKPLRGLPRNALAAHRPQEDKSRRGASQSHRTNACHRLRVHDRQPFLDLVGERRVGEPLDHHGEAHGREKVRQLPPAGVVGAGRMGAVEVGAGVVGGVAVAGVVAVDAAPLPASAGGRMVVGTS